MRIVFGAILSRHPFVPGSVWNRMQWVTGLRRLGHEVIYVEEIAPEWCCDEAGRRCAYPDCINRRHFLRTMEQFGLAERSCQLYDGGSQTAGLSRESVLGLIASSDLLINQSGHVTSDWVLDAVHTRLYVDQDPVYTQLWRSEYGKELNFSRHDAFCTVGLNIGTPHSPIPDGGVEWMHTLPPIIPDFWGSDEQLTGTDEAPFTTSASISGYGDLSFRGEWYGSKYEPLRELSELPQRCDARFELMLKDFKEGDATVAELSARGWKVRRAADVPRAMELQGYRNFIHQSRGEIGVAKNAYVKGVSGWFSDRTGCYMASGKPCVVQSTGFERCLPVGEGLITFSTLDQAVAGINSINQNYRMHSRAARDWAAEYLDYRKVLPPLLNNVSQPLKISGGIL